MNGVIQSADIRKPALRASGPALRNRLEAQMTGRDYAAVLREAVEFFDAHPYLPVPDSARNLPLYYEHPSPAEVRWLISIVADEGFKIDSSSAGLDFWGMLSVAIVHTT